MVSYIKLENDNFMIKIPNEGVQKRIECLIENNSLDVFTFGELTHLNLMNNYFNYVIDIVTEYLVNNQSPNYYKLIDNCYIDMKEDYVQCYIVKCNTHDIVELVKAVASVIRRKRDEYDGNVR